MDLVALTTRDLALTMVSETITHSRLLRLVLGPAYTLMTIAVLLPA
jgi:hypothetical protein